MNPEFGYGCNTCGPHEYCPDDAMARYWEDYDPDDGPEPAVVATGDPWPEEVPL